MKIYFFISLLLFMFQINAMHFSPKLSSKKQNIFSAKLEYNPKEQCITTFYKGKNETILVTKCLKTKKFFALSTRGGFVSNAQNTPNVEFLKKHINQYEKNLNKTNH